MTVFHVENQMPPDALDVSNNNGLSINWMAVRQAGVKTAIAKCSEGNGGTHPGFIQNWQGIANAHFDRRGAYHFALASHTPQENAQAAAGAIAAAGGMHGTDFVALDVERPSLTAPWPLAAGAQSIDWTLACLAELERFTHSHPWLYCSQGWLSGILLQDPRLAAYPLWVANINSTPDDQLGTPWPFALRQYTWTASVPGIPGNVDGSRYGPAWNSTFPAPPLPPPIKPVPIPKPTTRTITWQGAPAMQTDISMQLGTNSSGYNDLAGVDSANVHCVSVVGMADPQHSGWASQSCPRVGVVAHSKPAWVRVEGGHPGQLVTVRAIHD